MADSPTDAAGRAHPRRGGRRRYVLLVTAVIVVAAGWSAFWWQASTMARRAVDDALADARAAGVAVACPGERIAGYPFLLELRCDATSLTPPDGPTVAAGPLVVVARSYAPNRVIAELAGPLTVADGASTLAKASWSLAHASLRFEDLFGTPRLALVSVSVENAALEGPAGAAAVAAKQLELHVRRAPSTPDGVDVALTATAATAAGLAQTDLRLLLGIDEARALATGGALPAEGLAVIVQEMSATSGETRLTASGALTLRPDGLVDGKLEIVTTDPARLAALLAPLLPPEDPLPLAVAGAVAAFGRPTELGDAKAVAVPVAINRSRLTIGLIPVGRLPRLPVEDAGM